MLNIQKKKNGNDFLYVIDEEIFLAYKICDRKYEITVEKDSVFINILFVPLYLLSY